MTILRWCRLGAAWALACAMAGAAAQPAPLPPEAFYRPPALSDASLSPSGRHLAVLVGAPGLRVGLAIIDVQNPASSKLLARFDDADVDDPRWVGDDWLVFTIADRLRGGGNQRFAPGLFAVRRDSEGAYRRLIDPSMSRLAERQIGGTQPLDATHELLHIPRDGSTDIIVGRHVWSADGQPVALQPMRLNVATGQTRNLAAGAPPGSLRWMFDAAGEPRVAMVLDAGRRRLYWRGPAADWKLIDDAPALEVPFIPAFLDGPEGLLVTVSEGEAGYAVLRRFDFATGKPAREPLVRTPGWDFSGALIAEATGGRALGVQLRTDAETTVWFSERLRKAQAAVDARLPGHVNRLRCRRCEQDDAVFLVYSYSDTDPGRYALYRPDGDRWDPLGVVNAAITPNRMARLDLHKVKARDGLELPVWVTVPRGPKPATPRPAVLLVHGGPWVRGVYWRFNPEAQFLASRGYVVVEPEFRGSTGYGDRHFRAGFREWGLKMQDDLLDAVKWAADQGLVDPKRVCIAGGSYGGYAALMALARDPGVFRCGVSIVGLTDPRLMFKWSARSDISEFARGYSYPTLIGDPEKDAEALARANPLLRAAEIKAPVLLAYGAQDRRVLPENGTRMRDALQAAGNPPEWVLYPDEGHGWYRYENQVDFAGRLERFLAKHLQP